MKNKEKLPPVTHSPIEELIEVLQDSLGDNLVGVYIHSSVVMGCFNPKQSDLDVLVVVFDLLQNEVKKIITQKLLSINQNLPFKKGLELSIVLRKYVGKYFVYPTPYELHFGSDLIEDYLQGEVTEDSGKGDADLANHFMLTYHRGVCVFGEPISNVFVSVEPKYYINSNWQDVKDAEKDILDNPVYSILNLCRFLLFLQEDKIASKKEGGEWYIQRIDSEYKELVTEALAIYALDKEMKFDKKQLRDFARLMVSQIKGLIG
jgi:predicted nucleotidyltransferase